MSNQSYEKLHKLVTFTINYGLLTATEVADILGVSILEFLQEFPEQDFDNKQSGSTYYSETCSGCTCNETSSEEE